MANIILPAVRRIVAIGDLHGDIVLVRKILKNLAHVINDNDIWIGGDTNIVQVGDQLDDCKPKNNENCHDLSEGGDIDVFNFMSALHEQAKIADGAVYSLIGNYEIMNVLGDMMYVSKDGLDTFGGIQERQRAFQPSGEYAKKIAETRYISIIIGTSIFAHAGILPNLANRETLDKLQKKMSAWLMGKIKDLPEKERINSIFWSRIYGAIPPNMDTSNPMCQKYLIPALHTLQLERMIIGHTPQFIKHNTGINATCQNNLWRIDTGSTKAFDKFDKHLIYNVDHRRPQALEILNDGEEVNILS